MTIAADDKSLKKILGQKQPAILVFVDSYVKNKPLEDALQREAKKNEGELLVITLDASSSPESYTKYDRPQLPALVTLTKAFFGRSVKSSAANIRPADVRAHIDHLINDAPLPETQPDQLAPKAEKTVIHTSDSSFRKDVLKSKTPVLVDFWAAWCGPCQAVAPFVDQVAKQYAGQVKVVKLNVDENKRTANAFQVQSIPTFILFEDGEAVERLTGGSPRAIEVMVKEAILRNAE